MQLLLIVVVLQLQLQSYHQLLLLHLLQLQYHRCWHYKHFIHFSQHVSYHMTSGFSPT